MAFDIVPAVNLVLCAIISMFGLFSYLKQGCRASLWIAMGFVLFAFSHISTLLALQGVETALVVVRIFAYLCVIAALFFMWCEGPSPRKEKKAKRKKRK